MLSDPFDTGNHFGISRIDTHLHHSIFILSGLADEGVRPDHRPIPLLPTFARRRTKSFSLHRKLRTASVFVSQGLLTTSRNTAGPFLRLPTWSSTRGGRNGNHWRSVQENGTQELQVPVVAVPANVLDIPKTFISACTG